MDRKSSSLEIRNISFSFNSHNVFDKFSLSVESASLTTLLGPSGCGKTTLLKLIAGFYNVNGGEILIDSVIQNKVSSNLRGVGMVFQDYALFPHMTSYQNILYGLKLKKSESGDKFSKEEIDTLVFDSAKSLGIENLLNRYPHELSGGQQQRVALARAVVLKPKLLLMDEPLSSLDSNLRVHVREELKQIQKDLGITTIYVTHDQEEAIYLSDKIAVINDGKLLQYGTPKQIYFEPTDFFTANFIGKANFIKKDGDVFLVRPNWIDIVEENELYDIKGTIISSDFLGSFIRIKVMLENNDIFYADLNTDRYLEYSSNQKIKIKFTRNWKM